MITAAPAAPTRVARLSADPRRLLLLLLVAGLAASITLSETMLVVIGLWLARERASRRVTLSWSTHDEGGLTSKDVAGARMAERHARAT